MLNHDLPEEYAFISYSHVQKAFADTLKQFLRKTSLKRSAGTEKPRNRTIREQPKGWRPWALPVPPFN